MDLRHKWIYIKLWAAPRWTGPKHRVPQYQLDGAFGGANCTAQAGGLEMVNYKIDLHKNINTALGKILVYQTYENIKAQMKKKKSVFYLLVYSFHCGGGY